MDGFVFRQRAFQIAGPAVWMTAREDGQASRGGWQSGRPRFRERLTAYPLRWYFLASHSVRGSPVYRSCPPIGLLVLSLFVVVMWSGAATASPDHPLAPADTSSPRATLESFLTAVDAIYADLNDTSLSPERSARFNRRMIRISSCLDLSDVAPSLIDIKRRQAAVNIKEVCDRIKLPAWEEIPDAEMVAAEKLTHWRVPGTEIMFTRVAEGPRAGDWMFSADTVARCEEFYRIVERLPYRPDAGSPGLHDLYVESPGWMIPEAWIRSLPAWARQRIGDLSLWQVTAAATLLLGGTGLVGGGFWIARRVAGQPAGVSLVLSLAAPLVLIGTCQFLDELFTSQIRITGDMLSTAKIAFRIGMFAGSVMLVQVALTRLGEAVIRSHRLRPGTIDTQVVRLGFRIVSVLVMAWMVIQGADSMGFSVAPLVAGLGVGGLALALAAQHTIENFIAGLVLFADKPVRIGDSCQFGDQRGTVEQIGLRSTRIRGIDRTVISIPNSEFAKLRLVNFTRRDKILLRTVLGLRYETTADQLRHLLASLRQQLTCHPRIYADSVRVRFIGYAAYSLEVEVFAFANTNDWSTFLVIQEDVLLELMDVIKDSGCGFAFPSQTHYIATDTGMDAERQEQAEAAIRDLRSTGTLAEVGFLAGRNQEESGGGKSPGHRLRPAA